ncbi:IniB N-terminal domain-containing protein [Microbacterium sp. NPDC089318]
MTSPVETIADALMAFIMSLLRDPEAVDEFVAAPQAVLADNGLQDVCMADLAAVRPVIVDHPSVVHHTSPPPPPPPGDPSAEGVARELVRMVQQYTTTIDARSTILDQSVNQNIWTEGGDVTQLFDQEAVVASGDGAVAAGDDVAVVDSDVDVSMGDVSVGNETNDGSFNSDGQDDAPEPAADPDDAAADPAPDAPAEGSDATTPTTAAAGEAVDTAVDSAAAAPQQTPPPADVPEPADLLESDMTAGTSGSYDADAAGAALDDQPVDVPVEDD